MITNTDLTIFNKYPDTQFGEFVYLPHYIPEAWMHVDQKISVVDGGFVSADLYSIRIPEEECDGYVPPECFRARDKEDKVWTVQKGDYIVPGRHDEGPAEDLPGIKKAGGTVICVQSHSENFVGTCPHIRIGGGV